MCFLSFLSDRTVLFSVVHGQGDMCFKTFPVVLLIFPEIGKIIHLIGDRLTLCSGFHQELFEILLKLLHIVCHLLKRSRERKHGVSVIFEFFQSGFLQLCKLFQVCFIAAVDLGKDIADDQSHNTAAAGTDQNFKKSVQKSSPG